MDGMVMRRLQRPAAGSHALQWSVAGCVGGRHNRWPGANRQRRRCFNAACML